MQATVNNCLMTNSSEIVDPSLEKIKNVLVMFEKKKRNLEKRKTKLEDYKKKTNLNEDQQLAVSKYPEVVSNLELLDEFTNQTSLQYKEAEKALKKTKKLEKIEKKKHEVNILEYSLRNMNLLERLCKNEKAQNKIILDNILNSSEIIIINNFYDDVSTDWKKCADMFHGLFEGGSKKLEFGSRRNSEDSKALEITNDELSSILEKLSKAEWLSSNCWSESLNEQPVENVQMPSGDVYQSDEELYDAESGTTHEEPEPSPPMIEQPETHETHDSHKMNFTFLHESLVVNQDENGVHERPDSQLSDHKNTSWNAMDDSFEHSVHEDVFSSATQSEFMHSDNFGNKMTKSGGSSNTVRGGGSTGNHWQSGSGGSGRFRGGGGQNGSNFWRGSSGGRNFNNQSRYSRGGSRGSTGSGRGGRGGGPRGASNRFQSGQPLSAQ